MVVRLIGRGSWKKKKKSVNESNGMVIKDLSPKLNNFNEISCGVLPPLL